MEPPQIRYQEPRPNLKSVTIALHIPHTMNGKPPSAFSSFILTTEKRHRQTTVSNAQTRTMSDNPINPVDLTR
jgi:hypothetical protein